MAGPGGLSLLHLVSGLHPSLEPINTIWGHRRGRSQEGGGGDRREGAETGGRHGGAWEAENQENGDSQLARIWGELCGGVWELEHTVCREETLWTETQGLVMESAGSVGSAPW